jgi:uncharacterized coiled-coil DUF342 family protein
MILDNDSIQVRRYGMRIDEPAEEILNYADKKFAHKEELQSLKAEIAQLKEKIEELSICLYSCK